MLSDDHESSRTEQPTVTGQRGAAQSGGTSPASGCHTPPLKPRSQSAASQSPPQPAATSKNKTTSVSLSHSCSSVEVDKTSVSVSSQQGGVSHMPGMMSHQGLGQQLVHSAPGGGPQMQAQWRQPLVGQSSDKYI